MLVNLNDILKKARKEKYAVGLFNTTDTDMLQAAIGAAEELSSPIIIGTAEVLLPYGELKLIAPSVIAAAKRARVPVAVHYDHGLTYERCVEAVSYTHLDVYKRQPSSSPRNRLAKSFPPLRRSFPTSPSEFWRRPSW